MALLSWLSNDASSVIWYIESKERACVSISCEHVEGSCLGLFQGTEWTVSFMTEKVKYPNENNI